MDSEKVWRPSEILRRYERGERDFRGVEVCDMDEHLDEQSFKDARLEDADFSGAYIVANFSGAHLRHAKFTGASVKTCMFDRAHLEGADFSDAAIDGATFVSAHLTGAGFARATAYGHLWR